MNEEKKHRILVVDDAPINIDVISEILSKHYQILVALNGIKALKIMVSENPPDLVLLDIVMPEMSGFEVCDQMRNNPKIANIPVIFVSAMGENIDEEKGFAVGAVDYISKPVIPALLMARVSSQLKLLETRKEVERLAAKLSRYLSPSVSRSLALGKSTAQVESRKKKLTVFFSDIVNFTARTNCMTPDDLTVFLNEYLEAFTGIAIKYGGTVDKYIGDAVMVFFGDPETRGVKADACSCVKMALEMQQACEVLADGWGLFDGEPFKVRMGIATGFCTVGSFGCQQKLDYTIIGETVNLASRLETAAPAGCIFADEECWNQVKDQFTGLAQGLISVKGFDNPVQVYRIDAEGHRLKINEKGTGYNLSIDLDEVLPQDHGKLESALKEVLDLLKR